MSSAGECVGVDKSTYCGVIISALQVIKSRLVVVDIAPVAEGVMGTEGRCHSTGSREDITPGIVGVGYDCGTAAVEDGYDITLEVGGVVIGCPAVGDSHRRAAGIVGEVQHIAVHRQLAQLRAVVDVAVGGGAIGTLGAHAVGIVGVRPGAAARSHRCQLPPVAPGIGAGAVAEHVAYGVAGDGVAVPSRQQVAPVGVAVGIGLGGGGGS